jgi:hypothetical protein
MDLREAWKELEITKLNKPLLGTLKPRKTSKHPVQKLKRLYKISAGFAIIFLACFIALFFVFHEAIVKASLALVIFGYVFFLLTNMSMYKKIVIELPMDKSLKIVLTQTHDFISSNIRFQERAAIFLYPIAGTAGFLMGGSIGSGDLERMLKVKGVLIILVITLIILTPVCYLLAKWMYKISYGKCLTDIKQLITELERPD